METVKFTRMKDGDREDYAIVMSEEKHYAEGTADRLLLALEGLSESLPGYKITRLTHSLQTATRAWRDGADDDWIVAALLHDLGDVYAPHNHDEYAAAIIRPFVREQCTWVVGAHADFQLIYYGHLVGANQHKREVHRDSPYFDDCVDFCERWDQASFDPDYVAKPLSFFAPAVHRVFARPAYAPGVLRAGVRVPLVDVQSGRMRTGGAPAAA